MPCGWCALWHLLVDRQIVSCQVKTAVFHATEILGFILVEPLTSARYGVRLCYAGCRGMRSVRYHLHDSL